MEEERLKDGFIKKLMTLVLPITFQQFMLALVSASDTLMLGKLSQDALSAAALASQVAFVQHLFLSGMTIGLSMFAAQYWGNGNISGAEKIFAYVLKITMAVSLLFTLAAFCVPVFLMKIFTNDPVLINNGAVYLRVVSASFFLTGISQAYLCILKNSGRAFWSSVISSASVVWNIALNAVLIFGLFGLPKMGIAGAALATVAARVIEVCWCMFETYKKGSIKLRWIYFFQNDSTLCKDFWAHVFPVLGNFLSWGCGFATYSVIMGHLGNDAVAANSIANTVKNLIACFCLGLANGGSIVVGNELGAGRLDVAKVYGKRVCIMAIICGTLSGLLLLALRPVILSVTDLSPQAQVYLKWMLVFCSCYLIGKAINATTIAGIFCAGGDSRFGLICDTITMWCVAVPVGFIGAFVIKAPVLVVYVMMNVDEIVKLPAVYRHYKKYRWVKNLTGKGELQNAHG